MKTYCFFDFETDGSDGDTCRVTEAAFAIYAEDGRMIHAENRTVQIDSIPEEITTLTGLKKEHCDLGMQFPGLSSFLFSGLAPAKILIGHNILQFDCKIISRLEHGDKLLKDRIIVDTMVDLPLPPNTTSRKLTHLCSDRGITTPDAHGAIFDCIYTAKLFFSHSKDVRNEIITRAESPLVYIGADVNFDTKHLAKKHKFRWDSPQKVWWKRVRLFDRELIKAQVNGAFKINILNTFEPSPEEK